MQVIGEVRGGVEIGVKFVGQQAENNFFVRLGGRIVRKRVKGFIVREDGNVWVFETRLVEG